MAALGVGDSLSRISALCAAVLLSLSPAHAAPPEDKPFVITVTSRYNTQVRQPRNIRAFLRSHPNVRLEQWDGIRMPAEGSRASLAMANPLLRGLGMAFHDYKVAGHSPYVGLNNFISIALDPDFYHYILTTFRFVLWNLGLAFFTPIFLAFLLTEVPRMTVFFRTLFFLPQMTSGLVVTLLWKEMFAGDPSGTVNRLMPALFGRWGFQPIDWLGDPRTVMACVIIPSVWAAAGISSLIYLAALMSVPEELHEAATIDGGGILTRIRKVTFPTILPLVLINFVGAFIGTFQTMGNIFLLTFGGPGKETMVMGMAIWQEAYVNLRFSLATSYAWILGSILIGSTYMQLRILQRVDFRRAESD